MLPTVFFIILFCYNISAAVLPRNEYVYSINREWLVRQEEEYPNKLSLNQNEQIVDTYLSYLKAEEFQRTKLAVPPSRPIEEQLTTVIESPLYKALKTMPKGGNMHNHHNHLGSKKALYDIVFNSVDFQYLYVMDENSTTNPWKLEFFVNPPEGEPWVNVKSSNYYTKERILEKQTFMSIMNDEAKKYPTDSSMRWAQMNPLWERGSDQLINNKRIKRQYIKELLRSALAEGIQYIETRMDLVQMFVMSTDPQHKSTNGKKYIGDKDGVMELEFVTGIVDEFIQANPSFIGLKFIVQLRRFGTKEELEESLEKVIRVHKKYPKVVVGCDLVAEEDYGNSHLFFANQLLSLYDSDDKKNKVNLYMHTGETNFPDDQKKSSNPMDPTGALQNTYDAIALGSNRVAHGIGYIKHPYLMNVLKENDVAVEVCPVSNQLLGLVADLRSHPGQTYLKYGIPIVIGSDDPGTFGYDHFTVDWYMIHFGWGLDLADLKLIGKNAINYSAMDAKEKKSAMKKLNNSWKDYIKSKKREACDKTFRGSPVFAKMFPTVGAVAEPTEVKFFGSQFEAGICKDVKCKFGEIIVDAKLESVHLIKCVSPPREGATEEESVPVFVALDGETFIDTHNNFTYKYDVYTHSYQTPAPDTNDGCSSYLNTYILNTWILVLLTTINII